MIGHEKIICGHVMKNSSGSGPVGLDQYRGIYLKRIPTYSFPLILEVMEELGVEGGRILKNTGLQPDDVAREGMQVSFLQTLKLIRNILATTPRQDIGLLIGSRYQINTYGVLGYAMMSCPNWGEAMRIARHYHRVASSMVHINLEIDEDKETLSFIAEPFYADMTDVEPFTVEKLFASLIAVTKPLLDKPAYPKRVTFTYPEPSYAGTYRELFLCPVEFDAPANRFEVDVEVQQRPLLQANAISAEISRKMCEEFMSKQERESHDLTRQVTELLLSSSRQMPGMEEIADTLNVSSRTLRRNLQIENTTFQIVVDKLRQDLSKHYLKRSHLNLDAIAQLVGFTETTNFRRAFKRWEGIPPTQYRRNQVSTVGSL